MSGAAAAPVGVVVITRNRRQTLLANLERLRQLPERPPVVLVDNASTDDTVAAVRARYPDLCLVPLPRNRGAAARTIGAEQLRTRYVAFSDDDSWWEPGALRTAAELLDRHPRLALIAADTKVWPERRPDPINARLAASPLGTATDLPGPSVLGFLACACVVRREAFLAAGGYHPMLGIGGEEELLALDLAAAGWGLAYCPQIVAHHQPGSERRPNRRSRQQRNELLVTWLRRPWSQVVHRSARLLRHSVGDPQARRALAGALPRLPVALWRRRPLPPSVERSVRMLDRS